MIDLCNTNESNQAAVCAALNGLPPTPQTTQGTVDPEGVVVGYNVNDQYVNTATSKLYFFNGVARTKTGWNILN